MSNKNYSNIDKIVKDYRLEANITKFSSDMIDVMNNLIAIEESKGEDSDYFENMTEQAIYSVEDTVYCLLCHICL